MYIKLILATLLLGIGSGAILSAQDLPPIKRAADSIRIADSTRIAKEDSLKNASFGELSTVNVPFGKYSNTRITGAVNAVNPEQIIKYDNIVSVSDGIFGRVPGLLSGASIRGLGAPLYIIDGFPRSPTAVNLNEIEQITVLKDASAAILYGVQANNGVIMITTKRGQAGKRVIKGTAEYGIGDPVSYPKYLGSADYMQYYNEALANDGLPALYTSATIDATRSGVNPIKYPNTDYYNSTFLNNSRPSTRYITEFSGGNDGGQYYVNIGWLRTGSLLKTGNESAHSDRLNMRSNMDFKLGKIIKASIDLAGIFELNKQVASGFFNDAATLHPNYFPPLIDTSLVTNKAFIKSGQLTPDGKLLGGTSLYKNNPYGNLLFGGYSNTVNASFLFNNGFSVDMKSITKGLSFKTNINIDFYNQYAEFQTNTYAVYEPTWTVNTSGQDVLTLAKIGTDKSSGTQGINNTNVRRIVAFSGMFDYNRTFAGKHAVSASTIGYFDRTNVTDVFQTDKHIHLGTRLNYAYDNKYIFDFSSAITTSPKLPTGHRIGFSPSLGLGWVASNESFLKNSEVVNYLKLKASAAIMNTDMPLTKYYSYENIWGYGTVFTWNDGIKQNNATVLTNTINDNLFYEKRKEINIGAEASLFKNKLGVDASVFTGRNSNQIVARANAYPSYVGGFIPSENYGEDKYSGMELGLTWREMVSTDFNFEIGTNVIFRKSTAVKRDELYRYGYENRAGHSTNAIYGLQALGLFQTQAEIAASPVQSFGAVQPGDVKYKDQNGDNVINADDEVVIGNNQSTFAGGLNLTARYKNFTLFALATSIDGSNLFENNGYYQVAGDTKYSEVVFNRWTPATAATATYPRLSSKANTNNFRNSTFWLYDNSKVSLSRVQLNFDFPKAWAEKIKTKGLGLYVRGNNLATFSKNRDKLELNIGTEPQYRTYAVGLKASF